MFNQDLINILIWWSTIFGLSLFSLPITFFFFSKFWDKGYSFSKIISPIIISYLLLVGGVLKFLPFNFISVITCISILLIFDFLILKSEKNLKTFFKTLKSHYKIFIFEEILFLAILIFWSAVRAYSPDIEGLEKYMDWGFINSALRSKFLPPQDMWFSGHVINYYYFGHLIFALITKISTISSAITYNLSIATVCALTFILTFSLSSNFVFISLKKNKFKKVLIAGLVSALLLTFGGNLHPIYKIAKIDIQNNGHLVLNTKAISQAASKYWYPDATRFIGHDPDTNDKTIHEFPVYSFVVADLHGHMNDIPIVLLFMALLFSITLSSLPLINYPLILISGFILSLNYMTNAWDFAIYGLLFAIFTLFINLKNKPIVVFKKTVINGILTIFAWFIFSLPFSLNFIPIGDGVRISDGHTPFYQLFVLYGGFWLIVLPFFLTLLYQKIKKQKIILNHSDLFVLSLITTATLLIIIPEIVYLKDIYIYEHRRANTMFKLVYQAFIMYSLVSGYVFYKTQSLFKSSILKHIYKILFCFIFFSHLLYSYYATKSYYGLTNYRGLWGLTYLKDTYPDNFAAINWINKNITGQPVMLEAVGDSYTTFNQVSVCTGLPTVQGWVVHEWLWRGGYDQPKQRQDDVQQIYEGKDINQIKNLLQKYQVKYIFVGDKEYEKYPDIDEKNFDKLGAKIIFQSGKTKIYQL